MTGKLIDLVYGCLVGGAIGDALGSPFEGWPYHRIRREFGRVEQFVPETNPISDGEAGSVSDDSIMRQYLALAIVEHGGRITPEEYTATLRSHLNPDRVWVTEEIAVKKLQANINPWENGRGNVPSVGAMMAIPPVGIVNAGDPRQAYQDGFNIASVTQEGPNRDAAAVVAAGIAEAFSPEATVESVTETMMEQSTGIVYRACDRAVELATTSGSADEFTEAFYDRMLDWRWPAVEWDMELYRQGEVFSASSLEVLPIVMALLELHEHNPNQTVIDAANFGRDCDTIASLTGCLLGALYGGGSFREEWIDQCETANMAFFEELEGSIETDRRLDFRGMSEQLVEALESERNKAQERTRTLNEILNANQ